MTDLGCWLVGCLSGLLAMNLFHVGWSVMVVAFAMDLLALVFLRVLVLCFLTGVIGAPIYLRMSFVFAEVRRLKSWAACFTAGVVVATHR